MPKKQFRIPLYWHMCGYILVEAENKEEAVRIALSPDTPPTDGCYVSGSCMVDEFCKIEAINLV